MNTIIDFLEWISLEKAAAHLASVIPGGVTAEDVFRMGLERRLPLSVLVSRHVVCRIGKVVGVDDLTEQSDVPELDYHEAISLDDKRVLRLEKAVAEIDEGVFDVPDFIRFDEASSLRRPCETLVAKASSGRACLSRPDSEDVFQVLWKLNDKYIPTDYYPDNCPIVIRPSALEAFLRPYRRQADAREGKATREPSDSATIEPSRESLLLLIHVLKKELLEAKYGNKQESLTAEITSKYADVWGLGKTNVGKAFAASNREFSKNTSELVNPKSDPK